MNSKTFFKSIAILLMFIALVMPAESFSATPRHNHYGSTVSNHSWNSWGTWKKPNGYNKPWKKPNGKKPNGKKPNGKRPNGKKPNGKKPNGKKPNGKKPTDSIPVDGGLSLLLLGGAAFGARKLRGVSKK